MINKIVAIGTAGHNIAQKFLKYYDYKVFSFSEKGDYKVPAAKKVEDLEEKMTSAKRRWAKKLRDFAEDDDLLFIVSGASKSAAISLVAMAEVKQNSKTVIFIKSDESTINGTSKLHQRATQMVLQEFARSGLLDRIFIMDNKELEKINPETNILNYYDQINDVVASTFHMINFCKSQQPILNTTDDPVETARIGTVGVFDTSAFEKRFYYNLAYPRDTNFIYILNDETLKQPAKLMEIKDFNTKNNEEEPSNSCSFVIYKSDLDYNYGYIVQYSSLIQEQLIEE